MNRQIVLSFGWFIILAVTIGACASAGYYKNDRFDNDPISYLVGEWEGTINAGESSLSTFRKLTIYPQSANSTLSAHYGIPGTRWQGPAQVYVETFDGKIGIRFRTGSGSRIDLWLARIGNDLILDGTFNTPSGVPYQFMLTKKRE
ncbi:MAG: hypothetical protein HYW79_02050 [Parcubacteria group bacterium]|nr:hypothetical protein [Parcubacteria group bacterium]